jgi:hypothetical protein
MRPSIGIFLFAILFGSVCVVAVAQKDTKKSGSASVKKGEPPLGDAMRMTPGIARILVRDLLQKRHLVSTKAILLTPSYTFLESKDIRITRDELSFDYDVATGASRKTNHESFLFKKREYVKAASFDRKGSAFVIFPGSIWETLNTSVYAWKDERDAQRFADSLNRLIYEARVVVTPKDDLTPFAANVQMWREKPESRPKPPDGWDKYKVLAEDAIKDKHFVSALLNYEGGVEALPVWVEGWFNAALLYAELGEFESAANRMKHYLLLAPDASDAQAAREKVIIWESRANK